MKAGSRRCRLAAAVVGAMVVAGLSGCGSGIDATAEANRAAGLATTRGGSSGDELVLPINAYDYTVPERNRLGWARQILAGRCMQQLGYHDDAAAATAQYHRVAAIDLADHGEYGNKRRYVLTDPATAVRYGYHLASTVDATAQATARPSPQPAAGMLMDQRAALTGVGPDGKPVTRTAAGQPIPDGGCIGAADAALSHVGRVGEADVVSSLDAASYQHSLADPAVRTAFEAWSACMAGRGFHIADPLHASDGFNLDSRTVGAAEIATAGADVACKQQTHLTDIWLQSEVAYQKTQIRQHADAFHQAKLDHDAVMAVVAKVLAGRT